MRNGIIAGGNWVIDHTKIIDVFPGEESLANILEEDLGNGGGPYNLLKDLRRMGAGFPLSGIGRVGDDEDGEYVLADCRELDIDTAGIRVTPGVSTSYTDVMTVQSTGRRTFFHHRGANALLDTADFDFAGGSYRYFYLGYLSLLDRLDRFNADGSTGASQLLQTARNLGMGTVVDLVSTNHEEFRKILTPSLPQTDYLLCNDLESAALTGEAIRREGRINPAALEAAGEKLLGMGVNKLAIIHFPEGAFAIDFYSQHYWQGSVQLPESEVAGTAGAGDAFAAGVLFGLHRDLPVRRALELGVCVAACSLGDPKTSAAIRPAEECLDLGKQYGYRNISG